jgi:small subunit ribosomal protein S3
MSRKINPTGLRVGVSQDWKSTWYAEGDRYANFLLEDYKIRKYLNRALRTAGVEAILIERSIKAVKIVIKVSRPGVVIGRKGAGLAEIRSKMSKMTVSDIDLQIEEVKNPEASAPIVAEGVAMQIERRISAKRAVNMAAEKAMSAGAKGIKLEINGTINGPNSIAMQDIVIKGAVPTQTLRANIDFAKAVAFTRGGTIGIKVWIYKGEVETK